MRSEDGEAARAGAQIEHTLNRVGILDPVAETVFEQFADERTRNQNAFIYVKSHAHLLDESKHIGRRHMLHHTFAQRVKYMLSLVARQRKIFHLLETIERQI